MDFSYIQLILGLVAPNVTVTGIKKTNASFYLFDEILDTAQCRPTSLNMSCTAPVNNNTIYNWVVPYAQVFVNITKTNPIEELLVLDHLSEYTNYTCSSYYMEPNNNTSEKTVLNFTTKMEGEKKFKLMHS